MNSLSVPLEHQSDLVSATHIASSTQWVVVPHEIERFAHVYFKIQKANAASKLRTCCPQSLQFSSFSLGHLSYCPPNGRLWTRFRYRFVMSFYVIYITWSQFPKGVIRREQWTLRELAKVWRWYWNGFIHCLASFFLFRKDQQWLTSVYDVYTSCESFQNVHSETLKCCWTCTECKKNEYLLDEYTCKACALGYWPNENLTGECGLILML